MKYVLDASVALKWVLDEQDSDKAHVLRDEFRRGLHELIAPDFFPVEVAHVLSKSERRGIVPVNGGAALLADVLSTPPVWSPSLPLLAISYSIAAQARVSLYDCLYVALAEREGCELLTADAKLISVLRRNHPCITALSSR